MKKRTRTFTLCFTKAYLKKRACASGSIPEDFDIFISIITDSYTTKTTVNTLKTTNLRGLIHGGVTNKSFLGGMREKILDSHHSAYHLCDNSSSRILIDPIGKEIPYEQAS